MTEREALAALQGDDAAEAARAAEALWQMWHRSGEPRLDDLLRRGIEAMESQDLAAADAAFTRLIGEAPGFVEGWNKRATAYFLAGDYRRSLADCDEVIKRNPQHFGALSGYGQIYLQLEEPDKALEYLRRALAINPNLQGVEGMVERLESFIAQRRQRSI